MSCQTSCTRYATIAVTAPSREWLTNDGECTEDEGWEAVRADIEAYLSRFTPAHLKATYATTEWEDWDEREERA